MRRMRRKKQNTVLEKITVEDYATEDKSLAKVDGKVVFIENVVPGDGGCAIGQEQKGLGRG